MINIFKKYKYLIFTFLISFGIFYPSLFTFFTNDDFFFLKISTIKSIGEFFNFFNIFNAPDSFGMYRPLTTQVFYFFGRVIFGTNPIYLHVVSFLFLFIIIYLVYILGKFLFANSTIALISAFLYATSATHFGHLYYLATFQELGMTLFVLLSLLMFVKNKNLLSFIFFVLALLSKETAVITPILLGLIYFYKTKNKINQKIIQRFLILIIPFMISLFVYLFIRFNWYGFATGDSYVWSLSVKRFFNTVLWYLVWSFNVPESFVDFIGPGIKINQNLFIYWGSQVRPILFLFVAELIILASVLIKTLKQKVKSSNQVSIFCIVWFIAALLPVAFLPFHKFTFYLTLPLIGVVFRISYLLIATKINKIFIGLFLFIWTLTSWLTLKFTYQTNWISQEAIISRKVFDYFKINEVKLEGNEIDFVDTESDIDLPWSPTATLKTTLSDNNFFFVFFPKLAQRVKYGGT